METEDLVVNESGEREVIEEVGEVFPNVRVTVFAQAFIVEAVDLGNLTGFVVSSEDGYTLWVADLESDKESHRFDRVIASIYVVACL